MRAAGGIVSFSLPLGAEIGGRIPQWKVAQNSALLEINFILVEQHSKTALLLSGDFLYLGSDYLRELLERLPENYRPNFVFYGGSHTHSSQNFDLDSPQLGSPSKTVWSQTLDWLSEGVMGAFLRLEPVRIHFGEQTFRGIARSRRRFPAYQGMSPARWDHPAKLTKILFVGEESDIPVGMVWTAPIHPTSNYEYGSVSGDFPASVRGYLRRDAAVGASSFPILFFQSFAGDIRPDGFKGRFVWKRKSPILDASQLSQFLQDLYKCLLQVPAEELFSEGMDFAELQRSKREFFKGTKDENLRFLALRLGGIVIVGSPFEIVSRLEGVLRSSVGESGHVVFASCIGSTHGYLTSNLQKIVGGYEVSSKTASYFGRGRQKWFAVSRLRSNIVQVTRLVNGAKQ